MQRGAAALHGASSLAGCTAQRGAVARRVEGQFGGEPSMWLKREAALDKVKR